MRISLTKAAHADIGGAPCRKSGEGLGINPQDDLSAVGAAPVSSHDLLMIVGRAECRASGAPGCCVTVSQPCRAGLKFSGRPSGPWRLQGSAGRRLKGTSGAKRIPRGETSVLPSVAAAKALIAVAFNGTAKAAPFVQSVFRSL